MSNDSSSEHWSFENLTQSTDSGHPLITNDSLKNLNLPLSLVLNADNRNSSNSKPVPARSPSNGSTHTTYFLRRQAGKRPDSVTSETLYSPQQHSSQQRLLYSTSEHSMFERLSESAGRTTDSIPSPVAAPVAIPTGKRRSVYSDQAVFSLSRSPDRSLRPYGSASPPPTTPPLVHSRQSEASGRASNACGSDDRLDMRQSPQRRYQDSRQQSIVALPRNSAQEPAGAAHTAGQDPLASKSYGLPATSDAVPQPANEAWRRVRVERDYSQGDIRRFHVTMPEQLSGRIDELKFKRFVRRLNKMLADAEGATLRNVLEGCLAYATLYISTLVVKPHFKKAIERISAFVARENKELFEPAGLLVIDPLQTAFMFIEVVVL
ncbi:Golgin sub A member 7 [Coemansia sp. RSA 989]|nr:Golgin subfamily A member 7/ERF4 family-domain-containing protein [Coemansia mojavensis]KAJ1742543.1 Golgin sub A member 7 [Coemansia sp. RSA 1086]KAJ1751213.1 Golgin sub A member 7 [Coemansia sp. RSA 1821]KAJ1866473.1 Golgin sub A member 7 [Coemansia sp. RSA 989]KAJ2670686.1 Golgin sub A member 7 [Coemansia sp. RSA 1085]